MPAERDLDALRDAARRCEGCELHRAATQTVFGEGSATAPVVLVGEQPGDQEDRQGRPFVGPAGRILDKGLHEVGIDPVDTYITNAVKHFRFTQSAPGKRRIHKKPDLAHLSACKPWLLAELALVRPQVVVVLGATAARALLGSSFRVTKDRGVPIPLEADPDEAALGLQGFFVATVHPSAVLRAEDRSAAYDGFVADLGVAASLLK